MKYSVALLALVGSALALPQVSQQSDGQPTESPVSSVAVCTEYVDGQPQCSSAVAPVTQISDGQPQEPTSAVAPVTQISDGQPQAPTTTAAACSEYVDGQPQCSSAVSSYVASGYTPYPTGGYSSGYAVPSGTGAGVYSSYAGPVATGAAVPFAAPLGGLMAGAFAAVAMF